MLYNEGDLTEEQAEQIIGEKMMARINAVNEWMEEHKFHILLHSTDKGTAEEILDSVGLHHPHYTSNDSLRDIVDNSDITERELKILEKEVLKQKRSLQINKLYESYPPVQKDTVVGCSKLSAKLLLEYNHRGGDATVVFCVPLKQERKLGELDNFRAGFTQRYDPYLRTQVQCRYEDAGSDMFVSRFFYPKEGILFAYDRENNKIKINPNYNEEYYIDDNCYKKDGIHKGELLTALKEAYSYDGTNKGGKSR